MLRIEDSRRSSWKLLQGFPHWKGGYSFEQGKQPGSERASVSLRSRS